jgi:hypothetical protein
MTKIISSIILVVLSIAFLFGCNSNKDRWYRGNTHAHTLICGHADSTPEFVTAWYHSHGYNFLILSEHNHFIDPDTVKKPTALDNEFILIPGEEVTGRKTIHTTAMNIKRLVDWKSEHEHKSDIIQYHVDGTIEAEGQAILNHPNYKYAVGASDIIDVENLYMFELYNGHPLVNNQGDENHLSTEEIWDSLLTAGMKIYGVASDDAHHFHTIDSVHSNPGRGWVMVNSNELTPRAITNAMVKGNFYASSGVFLDELTITADYIKIIIDEVKTTDEIFNEYMKGRSSIDSTNEYSMEFIGDGGKILKTINSASVEYYFDKSQKYTRAKIIVRRNSRFGEIEEFYAWTQPVFFDERLSRNQK